jgi:hypothetical protein
MRETALIRKFSTHDNHSPRRPAFGAIGWRPTANGEFGVAKLRSAILYRSGAKARIVQWSTFDGFV